MDYVQILLFPFVCFLFKVSQDICCKRKQWCLWLLLVVPPTPARQVLFCVHFALLHFTFQLRGAKVIGSDAKRIALMVGLRRMSPLLSLLTILLAVTFTEAATKVRRATVGSTA